MSDRPTDAYPIPDASRLPELGVGITYSSAVEPLIQAVPDLFDVIEVEPQTIWLATGDPHEPYRIVEPALEHIAGLPGRKLVHSIGVPVGGTLRPEPAQLDLLRYTIGRLASPYASEHLSFNKTSDFKTGFFLPPRQTLQGVETAVRSIRDLQNALPVPLAVETGVNYLRPRPDEMPDGAFVGAVAEAADCGILLDLHNIFANAFNGRQPVDEYLAQLPLERVWEIHLAGGFEMDGYWLDAHSGAMPDALVEIARRVVPALPNLKAIIFEMFPAFVQVAGFDAIGAQMEKLHELWASRGQAGSRPPYVILQPDQGLYPSNHCASPEIWERALGSLAIGQPASSESAEAIAAELALDPGVGVINNLICEFRASMVVSVLRLSSRLMMLALGPDIFRAILEDFWSKTPPLMFAASEAEAFAGYLTALDLKVPQLAKVVEFERAVVATLTDNQARIVSFDIDPLPMLRALTEGRLTDIPGQPGLYEIEITPDGPIGITGMDSDAIRQVFPFH